MKRFFSLIFIIPIMLMLTEFPSKGMDTVDIFPLSIQRQTISASKFPVVIDNKGNAYVWGQILYKFYSLPQKVLEGVASVDSSNNHAIFLKEDGTVWAMGGNAFGALGNGTTKDSDVPVQVSVLKDIVGISDGFLEGLALEKDGSVWLWGNNNLTPVKIKSLKNVVSIYATGFIDVFLKSDGTVWYLTDEDASLNPKQLDGLKDIMAVSSGYYIRGYGNRDIAAIKNDGTVWVWDHTNTGDSLSQLGEINDVIDSTNASNLMVKRNGDVYLYGQFGYIPTEVYITETKVPTKVSGVSDVIKADSMDSCIAMFEKKTGQYGHGAISSRMQMRILNSGTTQFSS
ncbi:MAG: hypothetical protein Q8865_09600 [Bacillota bacterium]|nr:hypothetical protein [Bacillota bacterium]